MTLFTVVIGYSQTFTDNFITYNITSITPNTVEIIDYDNTNGGATVNIPATVNYNAATYNVTSISYSAFVGNSSLNEQLTSVSIPNSVTSIGNGAFSYNLLTSVSIPDSVTSVGNTAFFSNQLSSITIPSSVTSIGSSAFLNNPLTCIISEGTTPASVVTPTGSNTTTDSFTTSRGNIDLTIPSNTAGAYATAQWTGFNSVAEGFSSTFVVNNITYQTINSNSVFVTDYNPAGGTVVNIPATVTSSCTTYSVTLIGSNAFDSKGLTSVHMANNITYIYPNAFRDNSISSLTLSDNITFIGATAFHNNQLTSVIIPDNVTSIATSSFSANQLTSVVIPDGVTSIDHGAFQGNQLQSVTIGTGVTTIEAQAFYNNQLTSIVIPDNVTSLDTNVFANNQLTSVTISNNITSIPNLAFRNNQLTNVIIPDNVTSIGTSAFRENSLQSVIIPDNVTSIGDYAFYSNNITNVVFGNSLSNIGVVAFGLNDLTAITLPSSVTNIASLAFGFNPSLTNVTSLATTPPTVVTGGSQDTFGNYALRSNMDLHIPTGTMGAYVTDAGALWTGFNTVAEDALSTTDFELANEVIVVTTTDELKVISSGSSQLKNYNIYNITGKKVKKGTERNIPINALSKGIYILELTFNKGKLIKKFAK